MSSSTSLGALPSASPNEHMPRILFAMSSDSVTIMKATAGSSSPLALASSMYFTATGVIAASAAFCASASEVSQKAMTIGTSLIFPGPAFKLETGLGYHGNSSPVGSPLKAARPSFVMTVPSSPMITKLGMPLTPNNWLSSSFLFLSEYSSASQGCSPKYSLKAPSSLSDETKTTSKPLACKSFLYQSANLGVNPLHGGHQCALK
mmetsp:Transcript_62510/g.145493  ORF Transcript_62510/g.145493 Transcript_62510/m.145493 type:complete len:205 (-) Transcript_62510:573-1187(-)